MFKIKFLSLACLLATASFGAGYKIPEQSTDGVALSAANVAVSFGPDAAYMNPANMVFLEDGSYMGAYASYIHLDSIKFDNASTKFGPYNYDTKSKDGDFFVPTFMYVSPFFADDFRFGLALAAPAGISMRWTDSYPKSIAELFQIKVFEIAPSIAYRVNDELSVAFGLRATYTTGKAKNRTTNTPISVNTPFGPQSAALSAGRTMDGDSLDFGYKIAITYKPTPNWSLAATYRSEIDLTLKGDADIDSTFLIQNEDILMRNPAAAQLIRYYKKKYAGKYSGDVKITVPLPATLTLATAYTHHDITVMLAYDRTFWSSLKELDFEYSRDVPVADLFDKPVQKNWKDTNTYRIAVAYDYSEKLRLMAGFAYDEAATHGNKVKFELPDTDSYIYSLGFNYKVNKNLDIAAAYLYQARQARRVNSSDTLPFNNVVGEFKNSGIQIVNVGLNYRF